MSRQYVIQLGSLDAVIVMERLGERIEFLHRLVPKVLCILVTKRFLESQRQ